MPTVHYGDRENVIYNTSVYFDNTYDSSWLTDPFCQKMIKSIDKGTVVGERLIDTKIMGPEAPEKLSGGLKTLLLMYNKPENVYNASTCGDNCAYWMLKIGSKKDVTVNLYHMIDFGKGKFSIKIENTSEIVHNMTDLIIATSELF